MKESELIKARTAQRLINDADFVEAVISVQDAYLAAWKNTAPGESEKREKAYMLYKVTGDLLGLLRRRADGAKVKDILESQELKNVRGKDGDNGHTKPAA